MSEFRELCTHLLGEVPDEGLFELYESMKRIVDFYQDVKSIYDAATTPKTVIVTRSATMLPAITRTDLPYEWIDD